MEGYVFIFFSQLTEDAKQEEASLNGEVCGSVVCCKTYCTVFVIFVMRDFYLFDFASRFRGYSFPRPFFG